MVRESFIFYASWHEAIKDLPNDVRLEIYDSIMGYAISGKCTDLKPMASIAFKFIKNDLDRSLGKYSDSVNARSNSGRMGNLKRYNVDLYQLVKTDKMSLEDAEELAKSRKISQNLAEPRESRYNDNVNVNVNENKKKVNKYLFVSIENLNESIRSFDGNKTYLFLAYKFWELWKAEYSDHKHLLKADVNEWVNTIRLIIEVDKCTVDRLIAILEYFRKCHEKDSRVRDFWFRTVKSIKGLRNHDKNGVRYIDTIAMEVNDFKEKDDDFYRLVKSKIKKLKDYESSQVFKEQI